MPLPGAPPTDIRSLLEAAYAKQAGGQGDAPGGAPPAPGAAPGGANDPDQGGGPVGNDAFSFEAKAKAKGKESCGGCAFYGQNACGLYAKLNEALPDVFGLDPDAAKPTSWCKAYTEGGGEPDEAEGGEAAPVDQAPPAQPPAPPAP